VLAAVLVSIVGRILVVVVAQPEEPHEPDDQEAHVEHTKAKCENPPVRAHTSMIDRTRLFGYTRCRRQRSF